MTQMPSSASGLPIATLIRHRAQQLGLSTKELARRVGYTNIPKGQRRLANLCNGVCSSQESLIKGLPEALELPRETILQALEVTQ